MDSADECVVYRGTSLIKNSAPLGPYSMNVPRALWWFQREGLFVISEVPLYTDECVKGMP